MLFGADRRACWQPTPAAVAPGVGTRTPRQADDSTGVAITSASRLFVSSYAARIGGSEGSEVGRTEAPAPRTLALVVGRWACRFPRAGEWPDQEFLALVLPRDAERPNSIVGHFFTIVNPLRSKNLA